MTANRMNSALWPMRFAWSFEYEPQSLLDQVLERAMAQCRLCLGPAVEIVGEISAVAFIACPFQQKPQAFTSGQHEAAIQQSNERREIVDYLDASDRPANRKAADFRRRSKIFMCNDPPVMF